MSILQNEEFKKLLNTFIENRSWLMGTPLGKVDLKTAFKNGALACEALLQKQHDEEMELFYQWIEEIRFSSGQEVTRTHVYENGEYKGPRPFNEILQLFRKERTK